MRILDWANTVERVYDAATDWKNGYNAGDSYTDSTDVRDRLGRRKEDFIKYVILTWQEAGIAKEELKQKEEISLSDQQMINMYERSENRLLSDVVQDMVYSIYNIDDLEEEEAKWWSEDPDDHVLEENEDFSRNSWGELLK